MNLEELLTGAAARGIRYLKSIEGRRVFPDSTALSRMEQLRFALPESPVAPEKVLAALDELGSPATAATQGGRYFGFVQGAAVPASTAANWLAGAWNQNPSLAVVSPVTALLDEVALQWAGNLLGLPPECGGALVTGATMANFTALAAARHALLTRAGWDVESDGLFGAPPITVVVGDEVHGSVTKALGMLGLGRKRIFRVAVDGQGRMRSDSLPHLDERTLVCIQAGNVNTGAFDPAQEICEEAREANAWVHVDGAFGLWVAASPNYRHLTRGFELADSWATDAHKWPNVTYDSGIAFVRDAQVLRDTFTLVTAYLNPGETRDPMHYTPENSRRARGVELWATLLSLGSSGMADLIDRSCRHAQRFAAGLKQAGFEILNDVVINQVLVSFGDDRRTRAVIAAIQNEGTCWAGVSVWQGRTAMRVSVSSWATAGQDVERSLEAMIRVATETV